MGTFTYTLVSVHDSTLPINEHIISGSAIVTVIPPFTVTAAADVLVCKGNPISLTSSVSGNGSNPVSYSWSGPNGYTSNQQSPTIASSTAAMSGNYTVTASVGNCQFQDTMNVIVAEPQLVSSQLTGSQFAVCLTDSSVTGDIGFTISIPAYSSLISSYSIDWDNDGTFDIIYNNINWTNFILHTFPIGTSNFTIKMTLSTGCVTTKLFSVFVGSSPSPATMALFINQATGCLPHTTQYTFNVPSTNVEGTTYIVSWGDGTPDETYTHPNCPPVLTHVYSISSCGHSVVLNSITYNNVFQPTVVTQNPCSNPQPSGSGLISVGQGPSAIFTPNNNNTSAINACVNQSLQLTNTSNMGLTIPASNGATCLNNSPFYWNISPSTVGLWTATGLGSDNGQTNFQFWTSGSMNPSVTFHTAGNYIITLRVKNSCGDSSFSQAFCVEAPLTPSFIAPTSGCAPLVFTVTNNTIPTNQCSIPNYTWHVTYAPGSCGTSITPIPDQTTTNGNFNFTQPGIYTIALTATNACTPAQTVTQTVTVRKPPTVSIAAIADFCQSNSITASGIINTCSPNTSPFPTYSWTFIGGIPSSATSATAPSVSYATPGIYSVSLAVTNECGTTTATSNTFTVQVAPIVQNGTLTICSGTAFSVTPSNATPGNSIPIGTTYSWNAPVVTGGMTGGLSGTNQASINGTLINTSTTTQTATYTITPKIGTCSGNTFTLVITVNPAPTITTQPQPSNVCVGGTPTVLSVVLNSSSVTPTYQWYSNTTNSTTGGTLISGATNAAFNPPTTVAGTLYYYCVISLSSGGCTSITSNIVAVIVNPLPTIALQPASTQNLCVGVTIASPLTVSYTGGNGTATYQWYSNTNNTTVGGTPVGTNSPNYTPPVFNTAGTFYYYVVVTLSGNGCGTVTSNVAEVIVATDPVLTTQPIASQTLCQGATPTTLQVVATGGSGAFSYQWYSSNANNTTSGTLISGANAATYIPPTTSVGIKYYYCIISQSATLGCSVTSTTAEVIINASPTIVNQPISSTVCLGGIPTTLSLTYSNGVGTPTYQWYSNTINSNTGGTLLVGETNPTYSPPATTVGTMYYYCTITFSGITGSCAMISTNPAAVTITPGSTINQQPQPTQNLCVGSAITVPLTVTYTGGTGIPSYQWYSNSTPSNTGGTLIGGATSVNYTPPLYSTSGTYYYYVVINFSGNGCGAITSNVAEVIVVNDPTVTTQPLVTQTLCQNSLSTLLSVIVSGGLGATYNYQWYSSISNSTSSGSPITGETNSTYTPSTITAGTLYYYCVITQAVGSGCNATSNTAEVIVNVAPAIVNQPSSSTVCVNGIATVLSLTYSNGVGTPTYQWYSNTTNSNIGGSIITSATNATYTPPTITSGTTYYYCVITFPSLSGSCSVITTNPATVIVNDNPVIASVTSTICSTTTFTVTPSNTGGNILPTGTTYTWSAPTISPVGSITGASAQLTPQTNISQTLINTTTNPSTVTYTVTPTSGTCVGANFTITITVNPAINPNIILNDNRCFGVNIASITTNITGGIPFSSGNPYNISWTGPGGFASSATSISNLAPGNYNVNIADAGGCPFSNTYTITEPADIVITVDSENDITCFSSANGSINITVTGGTGSYAYTWTKNSSFYANTQDISNLSPGTYVVSVTDINNCGPKTATFTITEPPLLVVNLLSQINVLCYGAATGAITVGVTGGTIGSGYNFSWTGPSGFTSNSQNLNGIFAGTYNLAVTDANSCQKSLIVTITQSTEIIIAYTTTPITIRGISSRYGN